MDYPNYPHDFIQEVTLKDGTPVTLRPIRPDDAPRLQETFTHLSPETIYLRFLQVMRSLSDEQAKTLATVDYQNRMAIVGSIFENDKEFLIGVARYAVVESDIPGVAEAAVVVCDQYQQLGLGTILLQQLAKYAISHGIKYFMAIILASNSRIMKFIKRSGQSFEKKMIEPGVWEVRVKLI